MKIAHLNRILLLASLLISIVMSTRLYLNNVCKYRGRQMTKGQMITDCYSNVTCHNKGQLVRKDSCPKYFCMKQSETRGFKDFNHLKPYPDCCGGPICDEKLKKYY